MAKGATSETARMVRIQGWEQSVASEHDSHTGDIEISETFKVYLK